MTSIFDEIRGRISIAQAIDYLGLKATETKGDQLRFACPACKGNDRRTLSINLQKGFSCFSSGKRGDDATALVAHCKGIRNGQAAQELKDAFLSAARSHSATEPKSKATEAKGREGANALSLEHPVIDMLGILVDMLAAIEGGFDGERIQIPLRTNTGELRGTLGIATRADQAPLLLFSESVASVAKPQPDELRKLFRVV